MLLCYFTLYCLVDLILNYVLWQIAKNFPSLDYITESKSLATPDLQYEYIRSVDKVMVSKVKDHVRK
jgi:hypothetical protein